MKSSRSLFEEPEMVNQEPESVIPIFTGAPAAKPMNSHKATGGWSGRKLRTRDAERLREERKQEFRLPRAKEEVEHDMEITKDGKFSKFGNERKVDHIGLKMI
jgi:hypothetical protein